MKITDHDLPKFGPGENVIINGPVNLTNPDESINFTNQLALILDYHYGNNRISSNIYYKIQIIGGPYDGRIDKRLQEVYISK
jgi:hypothetical protein